MRIVQIIDSLDAGGAERMAVNYANALVGQIEFSGLVTTRKEGLLLNQIHSDVSYLFLNKKKRIDLEALFQLRSFVIKNRVSHVHAHSSSFFLACLLKIIYPSVKLIWHDHFGGSEFLSERPSLVLRMSLSFFSGSIAVNQKLKKWIEQKLHFKNVIYLPNFSFKENAVLRNTILKGIQGKKILLLANLREDKNHFLLLEVARKMQLSHPEWTFHLVGKDFEDEYSSQIKKLIEDCGLENTVFLYGSRQDVAPILLQSDIAVLTSQSEGLPVSLLEYGLYKKAVVVTSVGEIPTIVEDGKNGFIVNSNEPELFYQSVVNLIENESMRVVFGKRLYTTIQEEYAMDVVIKRYLNWLQIL